MKIKIIEEKFSVCQIEDLSIVNFKSQYFFVSKTDDELSLVCQTIDAPSKTIKREDNFRMMRIYGMLDFSVIGVIAKISEILAKEKVWLFVISTYNTDYILIKCSDFEKAQGLLSVNGYIFL